jgi:choline-sulfatase
MEPERNRLSTSTKKAGMRPWEEKIIRHPAVPLARIAAPTVLVWGAMKLLPRLLIAALCLHTAVAATSQQRTPPPDIFLVTIDTLRADHVHCYGYDHIETPALDALAKDGIRFTEAFTPSPITNTSHASILTGLLPNSHGVTDFAVPLTADHPTIAELLKQRGYHTAAFIGAIILDSKTLAPGFDRGFDFYDNFPEHSTTKSRWGRVERRGTEVVQHAQAWLGQHPAGPHFMWIHLYDPHDPYEPPPPYSQTYKDHLYDGEIAYADSALATFIAYLRKTGRYKNAIIVVSGDHGEGLGEHHEDTHGIFLYDSTTHVPLIMKLASAMDAGKVIDAQVRTIDIAPTLLALANAALPQKRDGESLKPYLTGEEKADRRAFGETDYPLRFGWAPLRSIRAEGFKYIEAPRPEFYDLHADPGELNNKYEPWNDAVKKSRALLAELRAKEPPPSSKGIVGQQTLEELKALGYLGRADVGSATTAPEPSMLPDPKDKIEEQNLLHTAMLASEDNRQPEARQALEKVLALNPKSPTALRQLGELELQAKDYAKAAEHLKSAVEARPDDATAAFYEGQALEKVHDLEAARDALESSLKLQPGQFDARLLLGQVYLGLKDSKAAEDQFEAALLISSTSVEAHLGLAAAQIANGNFAQAIRALEPLSRKQPKNADIFALLSHAYAGLGKTAEAQQAAAHIKMLRDKQ